MPVRPPKNGSAVFGAADGLTLVDLRGDAAVAGVADVPDEQPEQGEHGGGCGGADGAHQTM